ncbi:MAG: MBL fold metallo-hydrolase [Candidatus Pacebacteria bacterium]|nr:MBL fold metallo-hydrolase [Candidatus Paceibacterota bacterium]
MADKKIIFIFTTIIILNVFFYTYILASEKEKTAVYFLNVGQGDAEMAVLSGRGKAARILIDGGPNRKVLEELSKIMPFFSKRIDLIFISHPQEDHIGGISYVVESFKTGGFVSNGEIGKGEAWEKMEMTLEKDGIKIIVLAVGDKVKYGESEILILNPEAGKKTEMNENSLVFLLKNPKMNVIFTGDIGKETEEKIYNNLQKNGEKAEIDVLKVAHHGSKNSSSEDFITILKPKVSVIEVGKNSYGHPTEEVLNRLAEIKSLIFRTDENGTIKIEAGEDKKIKVLKIE